MRYQIGYSDNLNNNYGNYFVKTRNTSEIVYEFERARYIILGLDAYDAKKNYVYLSTDVTRMLRLQQVNHSYGNGSLVYKSNYFCNGLWHFNLHINSNLNCYMLVLVNDFGCRPPYIPDLTSKLLPPMSPVGIPSLNNIPLLNNTPTMTAPNSTVFVSPVEDVKYEYVRNKTKPRYDDFDDIDDSSSSESEEKPKKKKTSSKKKKTSSKKKKTSSKKKKTSSKKKKTSSKKKKTSSKK